MKSVHLKIPAAVIFSAPHDYAKNFPDNGVSVSQAHTPEGLTIQWDDENLYFAADGSSTVYRRKDIRGVNVDRNARMSVHRLCKLEVELADGFYPIFYTAKSDEGVFDQVIDSLLKLELPFDIRLSPPGSGSLPLKGEFEMQDTVDS